MAQIEESKSLSCETLNPFEGIQQRIDSICEKIGVSETCHARIRECERELILHFPVKMEEDKSFYRLSSPAQ